MTPARAKRRADVRAAAVRLLVPLAFAVAIWSISAQVVAGQRAGCERGKLDRAANARGWRSAQAAREAAAARETGAAAAGDRATAAIYATIAAGLEVRSRVACATAFPMPFPLSIFD